MNAGLQDLLDRMREHPAFKDLLKIVDPPPARDFKPSEDAEKQKADWIFRSGRRIQHQSWVQFLTTGEAPKQEKL